MQSLIHLLPDAIANQIAAGEVVQRPASVVKELLENALDAGATRIDVLIRNAGKTLIQISDNGSGMSAQDARMSFERHATSKIRSEKDLFNIRTLGFRGEALASIAAVAQVRLRTRLHDEELGTEIDVEGSEVKRQQACVCNPGSLFMVKNLFFNVPARRNFLKSNPVETRHILNTFLYAAVPNPDVHFTLTHNDTQVYDLPPDNLENRLVSLFGEDLRNELVQVEELTGYVTIKGFVGKPTVYRKNRGEQFFFVNKRFIRSHYLNHSVSTAFQEVIPKDTFPFYCIFLKIDPVHVDINIHPTKTEVKFDDEQTIYRLLHGVIRKALGGVDRAPETDLTDPELKKIIYSSTPSSKTGSGDFSRMGDLRKVAGKQHKPEDWDALYRSLGNEDTQQQRPDSKLSSLPSPLFQPKKEGGDSEAVFVVQWNNSFILTQQENDLLIIDQHLAHQRILFERFLHAGKESRFGSQQVLFPQTVEYSAVDFAALQEAETELRQMGFDIREFGPNTVIVYGTPTGLPISRVKEILEKIIEEIRESGMTRAGNTLHEEIARAIALRSAVTSGKILSMLEMKNIVVELFRCDIPAYSPAGLPTWKIIRGEETVRFFEKHV
jgi:DNA mismatch repair protein MutL